MRRAADFARNIQKNHKKRVQEQKQKEAQKREVEKESRKNLIGVRVVQKNLVYVTGLAPGGREDELPKVLRRPEYFGQYGNIQKISISNRKSPDGHHHSLGIYVTFEKNEDAQKCIQAVNGSVNGDRVLKAQYGTTKYCSAWLKFEKCNNPGCMFLHEKADEENSYSRQDLSSMNSILSQTQRPLGNGGGGPSSSRSLNRQQSSQATPPPLAHAMVRSSSKEGVDNGVDSSALPSSANWARNPQRSRRGSHATNGTASSPAVSASLPATNEATEEAVEDAEPFSAVPVSQPPSQPQTWSLSHRYPKPPIEDILKVLGRATLPKIRVEGSDRYPPLFDMYGGERRRAMRQQRYARVSDAEEQPETRVASEGEPEIGGGSLALGGEPEERDMGGDGHGFDQRQAQPPIQRGSADSGQGNNLAATGFGQASGNLSRSMTPQQLAMRAQCFSDQMPPGISNQNNMFQGQAHNRQSSRFNFGSDNPNSANSVKLAANPRIMAQQSSMMPNSFQSQGGNPYYPTTIAGPPPGLKSTGTPPNVYGQFGGIGIGGAPRESNELLQGLPGRNRNSQPHDAGKREYMISSFQSHQYPPPSTSAPAPAAGLLATLYGTPGAFQDFGSKQKKKGKKHRHANTSSSGGSGLVDLVDPSILQARMQHQSQSNAGAGQSLFGSQSQGGYNPNMMYNANYARW